MDGSLVLLPLLRARRPCTGPTLAGRLSVDGCISVSESMGWRISAPLGGYGKSIDGSIGRIPRGLAVEQTTDSIERSRHLNLVSRVGKWCPIVQGQVLIAKCRILSIGKRHRGIVFSKPLHRDQVRAAETGVAAGLRCDSIEVIVIQIIVEIVWGLPGHGVVGRVIDGDV